MIGAIVGDNAGFWIGRTIGVRWVVRHRSRLQLTIRRLKLGQYLFLRHGGKVVFFGRFVAGTLGVGGVVGWAQLHELVAVSAVQRTGRNRLGRRATGLGAYAFGETLTSALSRIGLIVGVAAAIAVVAALVIARRFERRLEDAAERRITRPVTGTRRSRAGRGRGRVAELSPSSRRMLKGVLSQFAAFQSAPFAAFFTPSIMTRLV